MKSVRQRKVLVWEKTSMFWWNPFRCIYYRISYSNVPYVNFQVDEIAENMQKINIFDRKSKIRDILIFKLLIEASLDRSSGLWDQLHFGVLSTDFISQNLEFCNTYCSTRLGPEVPTFATAQNLQISTPGLYIWRQWTLVVLKSLPPLNPISVSYD